MSLTGVFALHTARVGVLASRWILPLINMDLLGMIDELREEWERLNDVILALERLGRETKGSRGRAPRKTVLMAEEPGSPPGSMRRPAKHKRQKPVHEISIPPERI